MYYFSVWGRLGYKQPPLREFLDSHISEINRGRNRNLVRWWMCKPTASTRSSAVAEGPRDASCLSIVSLNVPIQRSFV